MFYFRNYPVRRGFRQYIDYEPCPIDRYQPFVYWSNEDHQCNILKSLCSEIGQAQYDNGTTTSDKRCNCDTASGYDFAVPPKNKRYCVSSEEDCSCLQKSCMDIHRQNADNNCARREMIETDTGSMTGQKKKDIKEEYISTKQISRFRNTIHTKSDIIILHSDEDFFKVRAIYKGHLTFIAKQFGYNDVTIESFKDVFPSTEKIPLQEVIKHSVTLQKSRRIVTVAVIFFRNGTTYVTCCQSFFHDQANDRCTECPAGTFGENCKGTCEPNFYGISCNFACDCMDGERCDKAKGCVLVQPQECQSGKYLANCSDECQNNFKDIRCHSNCNCTSKDSCEKVQACFSREKISDMVVILTIGIGSGVFVLSLIIVTKCLKLKMASKVDRRSLHSIPYDTAEVSSGYVVMNNNERHQYYPCISNADMNINMVPHAESSLYDAIDDTAIHTNKHNFDIPVPVNEYQNTTTLSEMSKERQGNQHVYDTPDNDVNDIHQCHRLNDIQRLIKSNLLMEMARIHYRGRIVVSTASSFCKHLLLMCCSIETYTLLVFLYTRIFLLSLR
ncbi:unnamed protein product [Mytilus edulis]|uniref:Uncharacterized protein n=1 Tax=Mytilus edulis TaxID=6550 RepID=A0A8S3R3U4_MYTED|nr:unnamed protein product [Mytilus edulis]